MEFARGGDALAAALQVEGNTRQEAQAKRHRVGEILQQASANIQGQEVRAIAPADLQLLFAAYDRVFFAGTLGEAVGNQMRFSLSTRMTRSAGMTIIPKNYGQLPRQQQFLEIRISVDMLFNYAVSASGGEKGAGNGCKPVGGIIARHSLEALQLVFEHELCHVLEFLCYGKSSCKKEQFRRLAEEIFGHDTSYHQLPTVRQLAWERLGLEVGARVQFVLQGRQHQGVVSNITKRATVMVPDAGGDFCDRRGRRFSKYYVPLAELTLV